MSGFSHWRLKSEFPAADCRAVSYITTDMSGGGEYPFPKYTWSPAGGWWAKTQNWQRKTGVALVVLAAVAGPIALYSSLNHFKFPAEERRKL
ncbi:uncharacterized protein PITG_10913 [Phytophthora infestans T30-4]|uniref:Uncharacterized protein n=2 Tax=Phytophthora infestans TaxID=4787 RepID=D0NHD7_PHYIT|nr:uncharacterized protein PITG_10913 [Phytophthora infestans T30-4]EEY58776.1 conserved hypothetical protein [Phytophthora infestans T30-4]|eukprot:XP_002901720.1 conserved hypothetical protein [Phytophthora infestans T30-4]